MKSNEISYEFSYSQTTFLSNNKFALTYTEWWSAGQEISGNAKGSRNFRERVGKGEGRIEQELCRNRKATATRADDSGGTKLQGETDQRTSRVSTI